MNQKVALDHLNLDTHDKENLFCNRRKWCIRKSSTAVAVQDLWKGTLECKFRNQFFQTNYQLGNEERCIIKSSPRLPPLLYHYHTCKQSRTPTSYWDPPYRILIGQIMNHLSHHHSLRFQDTFDQKKMISGHWFLLDCFPRFCPCLSILLSEWIYSIL